MQKPHHYQSLLVTSVKTWNFGRNNLSVWLIFFGQIKFVSCLSACPFWGEEGTLKIDFPAGYLYMLGISLFWICGYATLLYSWGIHKCNFIYILPAINPNLAPRKNMCQENTNLVKNWWNKKYYCRKSVGIPAFQFALFAFLHTL